MATTSIFDELTLSESGERFVVEPLVEPARTLVIDRITQTVEISPGFGGGELADITQRRTIYGILGLLNLVGGKYLVVVTGREKVGTLFRHDIYKITATDIISFSRTTTHLNDNQNRIEKEYLSMIESVLATPYFYFSYTYDLSHTLQRLHLTSPDFLSRPMHLRAEQKFIWNEHMLSEFSKTPGVANFCLPIVHGFVSITTCSLNGRNFTLALVSRRSKERAGCRLFTRGIDAAGHVANFVETEQIVETPTERASFVQIRGSMPFFWQQQPNLKLKPKPKLIEGEDHRSAFNRHFDALIMEYGRQVCVNLVDHSGSEGKLEEMFRKLVNESGNPNIKYEAFDFHKECSKLRYDRLKILIDRLTDDLESMSLMMTIGDGIVASQQEGVFRTNCIDCLDRTNVVQSMLARTSLTSVLQKLSILKAGQTVEDQVGLERMFKELWADHADLISLQYSGTGALKTDYTRTGKRTKSGVFRDGVNSLLRYYRNNFQHGYRMDALSLFLGLYKPSPDEGIVVQSPLEVSKQFKYRAFPLIMLVAISMFFANLITPSEYTSGSLLSLLFWASMVSATGSVIMYYGSEFVDAPRLVRPHPNSPSGV